MPILSKQATLTGIGTYDTLTIPVDDHLLTAVSLQVLDTNEDPFGCHGIVGIVTGLSAGNFIKLPLAANYLGTNSPLGWSGKTPTESDMGVYAAVMGSTGVEVVLTIAIWRIIKQEGGIFAIDP